MRQRVHIVHSISPEFSQGIMSVDDAKLTLRYRTTGRMPLNIDTVSANKADPQVTAR